MKFLQTTIFSKSFRSISSLKTILFIIINIFQTHTIRCLFIDLIILNIFLWANVSTITYNLRLDSNSLSFSFINNCISPSLHLFISSLILVYKSSKLKNILGKRVLSNFINLKIYKRLIKCLLFNTFGTFYNYCLLLLKI